MEGKGYMSDDITNETLSMQTRSSPRLEVISLFSPHRLFINEHQKPQVITIFQGTRETQEKHG